MGEEKVLKGSLIYLSPLREYDSEVLFNWINDRELLLFNASYRPTHWTSHLEWFRSMQARLDTVIFGIRGVNDDQLVGSCQLHSISSVHQSAELQIRIGERDARGMGIGTEACALLLQHAFLDLNLNRVFLQVFETNQPALRLYKRSGFKAEGTLRQAAFLDGDWVNVIVMSVLRNEYLAR